jgi:hypothetical protein
MDERTKKIIEAENDPRVLKALIASMASHIEKQNTRIEKLEKEHANKDQQNFIIEEQVKLLRLQVFGRSKEDRLESTDRPRDKSQIEALLFSQAAFPTSEVRSENGESIKTRWENLDSTEIIHDISASELVSESALRGIENPSSHQWEEMKNSFDILTKIQIIERKYIKEIHKKKKYKLKSKYVDTVGGKDVIITARGPESLLPGMNYSTDFIASVVADKYISHVPLERQTREMESLGLKGIKNSTLSRLSALAAASFEPMAEDILNELVESDLALHIDETPWKIQNKNEKDGYMWVISNRYGSYYFYKPTRSAKVLSEKLTGYKGPVVTDGYESYDSVLKDAKIPHAYCWAHARREFLPLEGHDPGIKPILDQIDELFKIERQARDFKELAQLRKEKSSQVIKELKKLLLQEYPKSREGSQKRKAILYLEKRWDGFTKFLDDTRIPLSNNEAERTIRHAVMGRKNYYGSGNKSGAETAATLFTIIETCKKNDLDPRSFMLQALQSIARGETPLTPLALARKLRQ